MAWYLAPSLAVLRAEVNARWPGRDHTSDGSIGDAAHQASTSDHNPNSREAVDAWDMDKDGVGVDEVIAAFERHPSAHYWIWQRQIASSDDGWRRRPYSGSNPHTMHVHFSIKQSAGAEQDRRPWGLLEADMALTSEDVTKIWAAGFGSGPGRRTAGQLLAEARDGTLKATAEVAELRAAVAQAATADAARDAELRALVEEHAAGSMDAEAVVRRMGELLSGATSRE